MDLSGRRGTREAAGKCCIFLETSIEVEFSFCFSYFQTKIQGMSDDQSALATRRRFCLAIFGKPKKVGVFYSILSYKISIFLNFSLALSVRVPVSHNPSGVSHYLVVRNEKGFRIKVGFSPLSYFAKKN